MSSSNSLTSPHLDTKDTGISREIYPRVTEQGTCVNCPETTDAKTLSSLIRGFPVDAASLPPINIVFQESASKFLQTN